MNWSYILVPLIAMITHGLNLTGPVNAKYHISSYYGSRVLERDLAYTYQHDKPSLIYWTYNFNLDSDSNLWIVSPKLHTVKYLNSNTGAIYKVMGKENVSGFREGYITNALLNKPSSIAIFVYNSTAAAIASNKTAYFINSTASECKQVTKEKLSKCLNGSVNATTSVDPLNVAFFDTYSEETLKNLTKNVTIGHKMLYIADTGNHCIRAVDLDEHVTRTIGGICEIEGFMDGPLGVNKLSAPDMVGVDDEGNIFVMDSGNKYIRMIDTKGYMRTLINGACFSTGRKKSTQNVKIPETLCYKEWIKKSGEPLNHIYEGKETVKKTTCVDHITQCNGYTHPLYRAST